MKVLITIPRTFDGGITNYFNAIKPFISVDASYFTRGKANYPASGGFIQETLRIVLDYYNFIIEIRKNNYDLIHINTFFGRNSFLRDSIFILIAHFFKKNIVIFFRGWDYNFQFIIERSIFYLLFKYIILKAKAFIVLSKYEKEQLIHFGARQKIYLETTTVDESLLKVLNCDYFNKKYDLGEDINLLFLSRVEIEKGIYQVIDAFIELKSIFYNIKLTIAGRGTELQNVLHYINKRKIQGIYVTGFVSGEKKIQVFETSHIFVFPTYFSEGMPNAVLEAFVFGLPVVTTSVGGLNDIFQDKVNGFLIRPRNVKDLKDKIQVLIKDKNLMKRISLNNYQYARENFISSKVAKRLKKIYEEVIKN